ncbi:ABC transporter ATP-binding protein [Mycoplasma putrefaciens]|uniref:ABC transporter, ATP-binding protein n=1 Tax=Mycoplasma putrefaciens (strain ATCC 15718 / NCTC 10155 / C30 KS-1 / KS-1) TaxID=743965 RepID=A0A7U3ZSY6_MYCPK|nr:ABC transporter ATP-binding protein [Mycoplasma putrefaciens]AEM68957.1 ABC transporter, ATP-binding protein [Mycoplasma putrefaciens KS1]SYV96447.1 ABC transporter ATP-binding protein [Mycoplasma putrefaciens]
MNEKEKQIDYAIEMQNITKTFLNGAIVANDDVTIQVKKGDIHALVGENGAGKSTLMSILFGLYQPTSGTIKVNGKEEEITNPIKANKLGIGMVHQHFKLVEVNTVLENIILGVEEIKAGLFLNKVKMRAELIEIMNKYDLHVDLDAKIQNISVGMQQRVEILKILYRKADILVFDEPTAVLTPQQIEGLLKVMKNLQKAGKTIIFISHKMDEIKQVANVATVIRLGKKIIDLDVSKVTGNEIAEAMVGRKLVEVKHRYTEPLSDEPLLDVINLTVKKDTNPKVYGLETFSVKVRPGEIVAIAGVEGNGQRELVEAITGLVKPVSGGIVYKKLNIVNSSIKKRYDMGMAHIPEDRHKYGMLLDFSVEENIVSQEIDKKPFSQFGFINKKAVSRYAQIVVKEFDVRGSRNGTAVARGLSGGNQQKTVVGREIKKEHDLLVVVQPTRGLDVGAIENIHSHILKEKEKGRAILLVSYELNEVMALADRIVVINDGKLIGQLPGKGAKKEEIGALMTGQTLEQIRKEQAIKTGKEITRNAI